MTLNPQALEAAAKALCMALDDDPEREGPFEEWWDDSGSYGEVAEAAIAAYLAALPPIDADGLVERMIRAASDPFWSHDRASALSAAADAITRLQAELAGARK